MNAQCTWRRRTGLPHVYNTAIRRALSPWRLCGSVTAEVHGCPRCTAQALSRPQGQPGGAPGRQQQPNRLTMPRDALPTRLSSFCLLAMASPPRDTRRNPLISQQTSGIVRGADRRCIEGALAAFLLPAYRVARRSDPLQSRRPGREDGSLIAQPDHIERPPMGLTVSSRTPTMAPVIARPVVHGRGLPQGADTRHEIRPLYPRLMD